MKFTFHLEFDPYNADHRRAAEWLAAQPDPAEAVVRMLRAAGEVERRLRRWEELAVQLAGELHQVRLQVSSRSSGAAPDSTIREDPESARKIDTMFR
jgi:ATP/maltotriose-dependent transcriptional regulator MalT